VLLALYLLLIGKRETSPVVPAESR